ncbi:hypothetical protein AMECASPLE_028493 [Ameca splendens]|uniref:Uncharacterized protein n=1 Tax=Ameca splendens TaxID=208324 RepID=A0ABV0XIJ4_9TELE
MNRNTARLVLLQDFPLLPSCPCFPENQLFQHLFPCHLFFFFYFRRRKASCIHKDFPVTALSFLFTTAVCFISPFVSLLKQQGRTVEQTGGAAGGTGWDLTLS